MAWMIKNLTVLILLISILTLVRHSLPFSSSIWALTSLEERRRERIQEQRGSKRSKKKSKERKEGISLRSSLLIIHLFWTVKLKNKYEAWTADTYIHHIQGIPAIFDIHLRIISYFISFHYLMIQRYLIRIPSMNVSYTIKSCCAEGGFWSIRAW